MEDFTDIKGFEGKYKINRSGNVFSVKRKKLLKPIINSHGYLRVLLSDSNKKKHTLRIHRLVAQTFIENPNNYPVTDHKNLIKTDNRVENLRWTNYSGNNRNRINIEKKLIYLGSYETVEEAELAYIDKYNEVMEMFE